MEERTVLVTGVGGNVGQGIIRNIRATNFPIRIVGCNTVPFSAGNHLCDSFYVVPYAYAANYIEEIIKIVGDEKVDLIIPSTDYEVYHLAKNAIKLNCRVAVSEEGTTQIYLDKYLTYLHHTEHGIPFAKSYLPSAYDGSLKEIIVKPREGRGSRGINVNPSDPNSFSDDYMVQELHRGKEITTAFYVTKNKQLHGLISLERSLENGATSECRVEPAYDDDIKQILIQIIENSTIIGSANLQSIVTNNGNIFPFEVNCRISGTNSIRSQFGFDDVKYTLQEHLYDRLPDKPSIIKGVAVRILMDVIYPNASDSTTLNNNSSNHYLY